MNRCPICRYRFETAADLDAHVPCPEEEPRRDLRMLKPLRDELFVAPVGTPPPSSLPNPAWKPMPALHEVVDGLTTRQRLVEHIATHHKRIHPGRRSLKDLQNDHGREHHRHSPNHRHEGRNSGPNDRPVGWYDGSGVVTREQDRETFRRKMAGEE